MYSYEVKWNQNKTINIKRLNDTDGLFFYIRKYRRLTNIKKWFFNIKKYDEYLILKNDFLILINDFFILKNDYLILKNRLDFLILKNNI